MIDRRLIQVSSDPVRLRVLNLLNERPAGTSEVAEALDLDASTAGRHLDELHGAGAVEVVGEVLNRGAVEPRYRAIVRTLWDDEEWATFSDEEQRRLTIWIIDMIEADARGAIERGTFTARKDSHASRSIPIVDEQGWRELCRIYADTLEAVFAVETASAERLAESGERGFQALSAMLCCELPPFDDEAT
ncbi:MAG TPA: helix-turn-helix domain-containing protein [Solirubrobacterales bacterium]|nr:helix-turn-helix domain-containing protein [Solirubrobacterales bacterium]